MLIELSHEDVKTIEAALSAYESAAVSGAMMGSLLSAMFRDKNDSRERFMDEQKKSLEDANNESQTRRFKCAKIRVAIGEAMLRPSEFSR